MAYEGGEVAILRSWSTQGGRGIENFHFMVLLLTSAISVSPSSRQRQEINKGHTISVN